VWEVVVQIEQMLKVSDIGLTGKVKGVAMLDIMVLMVTCKGGNQKAMDSGS
jgi:hypothetical protein